MSSLIPGGPGIAPGKHPTAERVWLESRELVCDRCGHPLDWNPRNLYSEAEIERYKANKFCYFSCVACHESPYWPTIHIDDGQAYDGQAYDGQGNALGELMRSERNDDA